MIFENQNLHPFLNHADLLQIFYRNGQQESIFIEKEKLYLVYAKLKATNFFLVFSFYKCLNYLIFFITAKRLHSLTFDFMTNLAPVTMLNP